MIYLDTEVFSNGIPNFGRVLGQCSPILVTSSPSSIVKLGGILDVTPNLESRELFSMLYPEFEYLYDFLLSAENNSSIWNGWVTFHLWSQTPAGASVSFDYRYDLLPEGIADKVFEHIKKGL